MVAEMDDWAFKNQARLRYDRFWIKASWQVLTNLGRKAVQDMKQLHRYAVHAETLQEVPDTSRDSNFYLQYEVSNYAPVAIELLDEQIEERWMRPGHRVLAS